ncbi:hypothetical protein B0H67DRAFT_497569 [Lasiosphaeris hirsuta]|uniref:Uncharacterized protein n=1 Tax=Lasiosphaeris hirsuta TaxID=260670 RepID=A0AA40DJ77_9PEZI|nr:hypothetical protein B0H67DRAFT_497569 [Lasiosphaeris hirsuta]
MSGSGGFYKYRCKYFLTHNCTNWVYVNLSACAYCVAEGRESEEVLAPSMAWRAVREICVPQVCDGTLQYTLMEFVETGNYWAVRHKITTQPLNTATVATADTPRPVLTTTGIPVQMGQMVQMGPIGY